MEPTDNKIRSDNNRFWTGLILIIVGMALLAQKMGAYIPSWLFTWPVFLIVIGFITGIKHRFQNFSWMIMMAIGFVFLADELIDNMDLKRYFWPLIIIGLGLVYMFRPKRRRRVRCHDYTKQSSWDWKQYVTTSAEDMIDSTSVFGSVKKVITSKNFKGGEIICFMGGAEINLSQADITGPITIEIIQAFGGTKLIVPPHWDVRSESVAIFAGIEDKRPVQAGIFDPDKVLILRGTTLFGGIDIRSY
jgi:predicted membrane protein